MNRTDLCLDPLTPGVSASVELPSRILLELGSEFGLVVVP
jgi:hypothetical protein